MENSIKLSSKTPQFLTYQIDKRVTAFSTTRHGGVSKGPYGEFNVNAYCGDAPKDISVNRSLLCRALKIKDYQLVMPHQVHGTSVTQVSKTFFLLSEDIRKQALEGVDALITNVTGICIGVSTADCIPIIIYDPEHHAAAVVHSGWRGTVANITGHAVASLERAFHSHPEQLRVVIGPGISLDSFEVGQEVYDSFADAGYPMRQIARQEDKWHIDLWKCCRLQLEDVGIPSVQIQVAGICTVKETENFFSARRLGILSGRILTGIVLR